MNLAIIIPAYNEGKRIGCTLSRIISYIKNQDFLSRIIVVDDGSTDATAVVAEQAGARVVRLPGNLGGGGAVQLFMDSEKVEEEDAL